MLTVFEYRCVKEAVNVDLLQHVVEILMDKNVFGTPLTMTANKIKKHQEKMKATPKAILKEDTCSPIEQLERDASKWQETRTRHEKRRRHADTHCGKTMFTCTLPHCAAEFRTREGAEQHMVGVHALYDEPVTSKTSA